MTFPGPTGHPLRPEDAAKRFDEIEAGWEKYRDQMCSLASDKWRGGILGWNFHM
jgi:hypothetical protein